MAQNNRSVGMDYEKWTCKYLTKCGYEVVECNYYCSAGEIDVVARHEGYLVFVEVKFRKDAQKGTPLESISLQKQKRISKCALYYMRQHGLLEESVRFDVVGIMGNQVQVIENAFDFLM